MLHRILAGVARRGTRSKIVADMVGTTVAHYRIISHIGAGGMGTVYLAEDTNLKRRVALKFLRAETAGSREGAARLLREARAASALDHPHIATIYEIGEHDGQPFIAMAHYDGETLEARLARGPDVDASRSPASSRRWPMRSQRRTPPVSSIAI